jgi:regulatory protein
LSRREHSRAELVQKLRQRGFEREAVTDVVERLASQGWVSDERFARELVRVRAASGYGPLRILAELRRRGVPEEAAEAVLETQAEDWAGRAEQARRKRFGTAAANDFRELARQVRFLERRGFAADHIRRVTRAGDDT